MGTSTPGVGGIVVLCWWVAGVGIVPLRSGAGRQKCFRIGQVTDVDVWPSAALWFP
jgi:hypothetical protein